MAKHFQLTISDTSFVFIRNKAAIAREAALDGFYVLRTNVPTAVLDTTTTVLAYKALAGVERAFRSIKTVDLEIRPITIASPTGSGPCLSLHARLLRELA